ncbi:uncharacterized protein LOC108231809 isoform X2 [Kryptolebias marmoratus]|uniref:uncharacterized protein LOC108231809 isoform X2 n=1 Tax=Kryptolebias marmoratus TaxID=37003 RepID=UPI000D530A45|nr:uncharacterized protein LOC108231809 isoform X2 [Kryptolebias marmoratus]
MMAVLVSSGVWLLVMLNGAVNGYPTKKALDPYSGYNVDFSSGSAGVPPSGFAQAGSGSSAAYPVFQSAPYEQPEYIQPSAQMRQAPDFYSYDAYTAPEYSQYDGSSPSGSTQSRPPVPPLQATWAVKPPGPFFHEAASPDDSKFASSPQPPGLHYVSPPVPFLPVFQPGDFSFEEKTYEHGNYDTESEEQTPPSQYLPVPVPALNRLPISSPLALRALLDRYRLGYPFVDYMLMTRPHPPGTYTLSTDSFEHGKNQWHNSIGAPDGPSKPLDPFRDPRSIKYLRRPVRRSVEKPFYGIEVIV